MILGALWRIQGEPDFSNIVVSKGVSHLLLRGVNPKVLAKRYKRSYYFMRGMFQDLQDLLWIERYKGKRDQYLIGERRIRKWHDQEYPYFLLGYGRYKGSSKVNIEAYDRILARSLRNP